MGVESVELATGGATASEAISDDVVALRAQSIDADGYSIRLVVDHGRTTEKILADLYGDPNVVSAEPNYLIEAPSAFEDEVSEEEQELSSSTDAQNQLDPANEPDETDPKVPQVVTVEEELADEEDVAQSSGDGDATDEAAAQDEGESSGEDSETIAPDELDADEAKDAPEGQKAVETEPLALEAQAIEPNPNDLTSYQWSLDDSLSTFMTPISPSGGYAINVPGWLEGRNDPSAPANASGTVCIMDTGIDATHPDLQGVLYNFEESLPAERCRAPRSIWPRSLRHQRKRQQLCEE